jgi:hypothetical protein
MKQRRIFCIAIPLALIVVAAAVAIPLFSDTDVARKPIPAVVDETFEVGTSAMRAYLNPETGQLEVRKALLSEFELDAETREALRRDTEGLVMQHHPDGSVSVNLKGRFQNATIAHIDENGVMTICTDHAHHAQHALDEKISTTQTLEVE